MHILGGREDKKITTVRLTYNPGHNILQLYNILLQTRFITSKRKLDVQYSKLGIRVASRVAERSQEIRKYRKISNLGGYIAQCLVSLQELTLCKQQLKSTQKQIPNFSFPAQFYRITSFRSKYFVRDCRRKQYCRHCTQPILAFQTIIRLFCSKMPILK